MDLQHQWQSLCSGYTSDAALVLQLWAELEQAYTAQSRHYHTLDHLTYMLQLASEYQQPIEKYDLLCFTIFYHDIVYNPARSDNEAKSAELAENRLLKLGITARDIAIVKEMILATKAHQRHEDDTINLLLDLDLAILGATWQAYDRYRKAIRKEYSLYPDLLYKPGRRKVLQHFLSQPSIYKTPLFQQELEAQARQNLQRELEAYT